MYIKNNKISKKHHYIPQFFLKSFAIKEGKKYIINVFDKQNLNKFTNSVDNIGYIKNFHTIKVDGEDSDFIEKAHNEVYERKYSIRYKTILRKFENIRQDINVINCLSNQRYIDIYLNGQISDSEKIFLSFLLAYFVLRGKKWREFGEESFKKIEELMRDTGKAYKVDNIEENIRNEIGVIEGVKYAQLQAAFDGEGIEQFANYFYKHIWNIGFNMTDNYFYTSDNVHALTTMWKEQPAWLGVGYTTPGNTVIFPLSPKICIIMYDPIYLNNNNINIINNDYVKLYNKEVKMINDEIILSSIDQVYSIDGNWGNLDECYKINNIKKGHKPYEIH